MIIHSPRRYNNPTSGTTASGINFLPKEISAMIKVSRTRAPGRPRRVPVWNACSVQSAVRRVYESPDPVKTCEVVLVIFSLHGFTSKVKNYERSAQV